MNKDTINKLKKETKKPFLISCSGGPDSIYLATKIAEHFTELNHHLVYFNHQLRPNEIENEIKIVKTLGKKLKMVVHVKKLTITKKNQKTFRDARIEKLKEICESNQLEVVLLGHHLNDDIETLMMQLFKGATSNFRGIPFKTKIDNITFIHPLLTTAKETILNNLNQKKIQFSEDSSNQDSNYERNWIRKLLNQCYNEKQFNHLQLKNSLEYLKSYEEKLSDLSDKTFNHFIQFNNHYLIEKNKITSQDFAIFILKIIIEKKFNSYVNQNDLKKIEKAFNTNVNKKIFFSECQLEMDYKWIWICKTNKNRISSKKLNLGITSFNLGCFCTTQMKTNHVSTKECLAISKHEFKQLRVTSISDCPIKFENMKKKLRSAEISPIEQEFYPVIFTSQKILWIPKVLHTISKGNIIITYKC